jgi:hypothetical protein
MGFALTTALIVAVAVAVGLMRYFFGDRGVNRERNVRED